MNRVTIVALTLGLAANALAQQAPAANPREEKIVAVINGEKLSAAQLDRLYARINPQMRANYERSGGKIQFLDQYINQRLLLQEAVKSRFDKRPDIAAELEAAKDATLFDRYVREVVALEVISESEMRAFYDKNKNSFMREETVKARHIIATPQAGNVTNNLNDDAGSIEDARKKMMQLKKQLDAGANFAELAASHSEDGSATSGGDLGWFGRGKMVGEFEEVAFSLKPGETSDVIETQFGFHIVRLDDRKAGGIPPYEEVRGEIRERFMNERAEKVLERVSALTRELRTTSTVQINRENL
jgi:peptidyl-prolyl cis-trans isomerase C